MNVGYRAVVELVVAAAAVAATGFSWLQSRSTIAVAPVVDGQPPTMSVVYDPPQLVLTLLVAAVAGTLAVVGVSRLRRARPTS